MALESVMAQEMVQTPEQRIAQLEYRLKAYKEEEDQNVMRIRLAIVQQVHGRIALGQELPSAENTISEADKLVQYILTGNPNETTVLVSELKSFIESALGADMCEGEFRNGYFKCLKNLMIDFGVYVNTEMAEDLK